MKDEKKERLKEMAIGNFKTFVFTGFKDVAEKLKLQPEQKALFVKDVIEAVLKEFRCTISCHENNEHGLIMQNLIFNDSNFEIVAMDGITDEPDARVKLEITDDDLRVKDL